MSTIAEIHGKAPISTSEDVLTADVLGALRYLPADRGILGWLRSVRGLGERLPADPDASVRLHFWPLGASREPDALVELHAGGRVIHVVIEAKYLSGASDNDLEEVEQDDESIIVVGNQLADQLRDLGAGQYTVWRRGARSRALALTSDPADRYLLYLTAHPMRPRTELRRAAALAPELADRLVWASWYDMHAYLSEQRAELAEFPYGLVVNDLLGLLARKGFRMFAGVMPPWLRGVVASAAGFWAGPDATIEQPFYGIHTPIELSLPNSGGFWKGSDARIEQPFYGIHSPADLSLPNSGGFWRN